MKPKMYVKFRDMPGDIPKQEKIQMLENRWDESEKRRAKSYRKQVRSRERAVLKRRFNLIISNDLKK